jgi:uncharacterized SAM-dependent methyltransferase
LLKRLVAAGNAPVFSPVDVSVGMVITALETARAIPGVVCAAPLVCDLLRMEDLHSFLAPHTPPGGARLFTLFGIIPNFAPPEMRPWLMRLLRPGDWLLCSANLAPGPDYRAGVEAVLPQYDNPETREWLLTLFTDLGIELADGRLVFQIVAAPEDAGLLRIQAELEFQRSCRVEVEGEAFAFDPGERVQFFVSYRHTRETLRDLLTRCSLDAVET